MWVWIVNMIRNNAPNDKKKSQNQQQQNSHGTPIPCFPESKSYPENKP